MSLFPLCSEANLVVSDDGVELAEGGEAEEGVDDVGRQVDRGLPLLSEIGEDLRKFESPIFSYFLTSVPWTALRGESRSARAPQDCPDFSPVAESA